MFKRGGHADFLCRVKHSGDRCRAIDGALSCPKTESNIAFIGVAPCHILEFNSGRCMRRSCLLRKRGM